MRRSEGAPDTKRQIEAENAHARSAKGVGDRNQERARAVGAGSMRQDQAIFRRRCGLVKEPANRVLFKAHDVIRHAHRQNQIVKESLCILVYWFCFEVFRELPELVCHNCFDLVRILSLRSP